MVEKNYYKLLQSIFLVSYTEFSHIKKQIFGE